MSLHRQLAEYFWGRWAGRAKPYPGWQMKTGAVQPGEADRMVPPQPHLHSGSGVANLRKIANLPMHLATARMWGEYAELMTDLSFVEAKFHAILGASLAADLDLGLLHCPDDTRLPVECSESVRRAAAAAP